MKLPENCHHIEETTSTQDYAFELAQKNELPVWGSVLAAMQTAARGQLRKSWQSLKGNLFLSVRLPDLPPFSTQAASVATGALFALALREAGHDVFIKWPNDLVCEKFAADLQRSSYLAKIGGILLEEKNRIIIAGIGINLRSAPDAASLIEKPKLPVAALIGQTASAPETVWAILHKNIHKIYNQFFTSDQWLEKANALLVWKNREVLVEDQDIFFKGIFLGINLQGEALIETGNGLKKICSGHLSIVQ